MDFKRLAEEDRQRANAAAASARKDDEREAGRRRAFDASYRGVFQRYSSEVVSSVNAYNTGNPPARITIRHAGQFDLFLSAAGNRVAVTFDATAEVIEIGEGGSYARLLVVVDNATQRVWARDEVEDELTEEQFAAWVINAVRR